MYLDLCLMTYSPLLTSCLSYRLLCLARALQTRPIMRISHARSRYIYDLYYKRELISRELYDWLLKQGYADAK